MPDTSSDIRIRDYMPEDLTFVIDRHAELYKIEHGFDDTFRSYVEGPVRQFGLCADREKENLWIAESGGRRAGMIAAVRADETTAQLRWFLIEPDMRGQGIGQALFCAAVGFCIAKGYSRIILWTVSRLEAARHVYKKQGFILSETVKHDIWGLKQAEERWELEIKGASVKVISVILR